MRQKKHRPRSKLRTGHDSRPSAYPRPRSRRETTVLMTIMFLMIAAILTLAWRIMRR